MVSEVIEHEIIKDPYQFCNASDVLYPLDGIKNLKILYVRIAF